MFYPLRSIIFDIRLMHVPSKNQYWVSVRARHTTLGRTNRASSSMKYGAQHCLRLATSEDPFGATFALSYTMAVHQDPIERFRSAHALCGCSPYGRSKPLRLTNCGEDSPLASLIKPFLASYADLTVEPFTTTSF